MTERCSISDVWFNLYQLCYPHKNIPIDPEFPKNHKTVGKHSTSDGEYTHLVWGPGRADAESSTNKDVQDAYKTRG